MTFVIQIKPKNEKANHDRNKLITLQILTNVAMRAKIRGSQIPLYIWLATREILLPW